MKTICYVLSMCLLFTSCYSYRTVDLEKEGPIVGQKYRIKALDKKAMKVIVMGVDDRMVTISYKEDETQFAYSQIKEIHEQKFSWVKTIGLPVVAVFGAVMIAFLLGDYPLDLNLGGLQVPN